MTITLVVNDQDEIVLDKLIGKLNKLDAGAIELVQTTAKEVWAELQAQLLSDLQFYPPVPPGSRYKRTYRLKRGWDIDLELNDGRVTVVVRNATHYTKWVVGTLSSISAVARATQRAFHARHGWHVAGDTTNVWFTTFKEAFIEAFVEAVLQQLQGAS